MPVYTTLNGPLVILPFHKKQMTLVLALGSKTGWVLCGFKEKTDSGWWCFVLFPSLFFTSLTLRKFCSNRSFKYNNKSVSNNCRQFFSGFYLVSSCNGQFPTEFQNPQKILKLDETAPTITLEDIETHF